MDLYGVRCALEAIEADPDIITGALWRALLESSELDAVRGRLHSAFQLEPAVRGTEVYIEETGTGDSDIRISVAGEEYTVEANCDLDGGGVDDTAAV